MTKATFRYVLLIFAIIIVFNWKVLLTSQFTFLAGHEGVSSAYSWYSFWARTVKAGSLPIWDPYTRAGHPFVGEMQTGAFYPLNVLLLLAPLNRNGVFPRWVYDDSFVIAHLLGMLFMFALVREMKMSRFRSLLAAICFSLAGPMNNNMAWPDMAHSAIWLPLIFLFFLRAVRQKETKQVVVNALLSGLCFGMSILAGRLHLVIMQGIFIVTAAAFYLAHSRWQTRNRSSQRHHWLWAAGLAALIVAVGACAGAVQLLPSHEYSKLSLRFTEAGVLPTLQKIPYDHLPDKLFPNAWVGLLLPFGFNGKMGEVEGWNPYIGVLAVLFVLIGVWKTWDNLWTRYFAGLAVVVFLVALGSLSLLHGILYATVPLFYMVRRHPFHLPGAIFIGDFGGVWF